MNDELTIKDARNELGRAYDARNSYAMFRWVTKWADAVFDRLEAFAGSDGERGREIEDLKGEVSDLEADIEEKGEELAALKKTINRHEAWIRRHDGDPNYDPDEIDE